MSVQKKSWRAFVFRLGYIHTMDILSHGLWGATVIRERKLVWWAFLAGMAPDIFGSGAAFVYLLSVGKFWGAGIWQYLPEWTKALYHFNHSLPAVFIYWLILITFFRGYKIMIVPYLLHVLLDAFTHANNLVDRLLYPLEVGVEIHGLNWWEHGWIMGLNFLGLISVNALLWFRARGVIR